MQPGAGAAGEQDPSHAAVPSRSPAWRLRAQPATSRGAPGTTRRCAPARPRSRAARSSRAPPRCAKGRSRSGNRSRAGRLPNRLPEFGDLRRCLFEHARPGYRTRTAAKRPGASFVLCTVSAIVQQAPAARVLRRLSSAALPGKLGEGRAAVSRPVAPVKVPAMRGWAAPRAGRGPTDRSYAKAIAALRAEMVTRRVREFVGSIVRAVFTAIASAIRSQRVTEMVAAALNRPDAHRDSTSPGSRRMRPPRATHASG
jgi:hypothetical protein